MSKKEKSKKEKIKKEEIKKTIATYRYGDEKRSNSKFRPQSRHYNDITSKVKEYLFDNMEEYFVCKEDIACKLKIKVEEAEQALHKLNLEGLISQPWHVGGPHDSSRERPWGDGSVSGWQADRYYPNVKNYIINYLKSNQHDEFRDKIIEVILNSSNSIISHVLSQCSYPLLSNNERKKMLKKIIDSADHSYRFINEYENKERAIAFSNILKNASVCSNLLINNNVKLAITERKKLFNTVFRDGFHTHILVQTNNLLKSEKEQIVKKALRESNFYLLSMIDQCTTTKINKELQDKMDGFLTMQKLTGNEDVYKDGPWRTGRK